MISSRTPILLVFIALFLTSCATSSITSLKSDKIHGPYKKIFILINNSERADKFINGFIEKVKDELTIRHTEAEFYIASRLTLDTKQDIDNKINTFQPGVILIITQTESMIGGGIGFGDGKGSTAGTFDLKLFDKTPDNMIWRGQLTAYGYYGISTAGKKAAEKIMKNIINYYAAITLPLISLALLTAQGLNGLTFVILLFIYAFLYHPLISGFRLISLDAIKKSDIKYNFIPGWNMKYFSLLFFDKA